MTAVIAERATGPCGVRIVRPPLLPRRSVDYHSAFFRSPSANTTAEILS